VIYKEQLSCHDSLAVEPKQPPQLNPQLNQCHEFVCVPEQSSLIAQEVGSPIAESQWNPVITEIVTLTRKKRMRSWFDAQKRCTSQERMRKKVGSKNKKDALPKMAVANPLLSNLKLQGNK